MNPKLLQDHQFQNLETSELNITGSAVRKYKVLLYFYLTCNLQLASSQLGIEDRSLEFTVQDQLLNFQRGCGDGCDVVAMIALVVVML